MRPRVQFGLTRRAVYCALLMLGLVTLCATGTTAAASVRDEIQARIEAGGVPLAFPVAGATLRAGGLLPGFYVARFYRPAWTDGKVPSAAAAQALTALRSAHDQGLESADYHMAALERLLAKLPRRGAVRDRHLADLDLLLSDAVLLYAAHLRDGRVAQPSLTPRATLGDDDADLAPWLERALATGAVDAALARLAPPQPDYRRLRAALARYRAIAAAGDWEPVPAGPTLHPGERAPRVAALRRRLVQDQDLNAPAPPADEARYDPLLAQAVRRFQARHGLEEDGVVGAGTLAALNVSAADRAAQLAVNLERWRWLEPELGARHLRVNIAAFALEVIESDAPVLSMRVVVGRPYRRTPVFSDRIRYLVLNPYWEVPPSLAAQDKLPLIRRDPGYLAREHFRVLRGWDAREQEVSPASVDWTRVPARSFPYRLRQDPGPWNALGRVKFMFPNAHNVYLHDTPARELFTPAERGFSSGCIRLEKALALSDYLLAGNPKWPPPAIREAIASGATRTVLLEQPLPVHLVYWTAWTDQGRLAWFGRDLYDRDTELLRALQAPLP